VVVYSSVSFSIALKPSEYSLLHRLERFIYVGDDRQIVHRFCRGQEVSEPEMI
jgi:guanine deaminase